MSSFLDGPFGQYRAAACRPFNCLQGEESRKTKGDKDGEDGDEGKRWELSWPQNAINTPDEGQAEANK